MRYKDKQPHDTVECIKGYLNGKYSLTFDCKPSNTGQIAPSYSLVSCELGLIVNGKGITEEYAQASAYGEFFERFFNLVFVRLGNVTPIDLNISYPFSCYDEYFVRNEVKKIVEKEVDKIEKADYLVDLYMEYIDAYYGRKLDQIPCIKFQSANTETVVVPIPVADRLLGTNGMAAGNTFEEAYVQGFSEILERKVIKDLNAGLVIPDIADKKLLEIPIMDSINNCFQDDGDISVKVFTFERHYCFPVVAILIIDKRRKEYKIKFGAHCTFEHALERCVSEMVQGAEIKDYSKWIHIRRACISNEGENMDIFKDGSGTISDTALRNLLLTKSVYSTKWFPKTNKEAFEAITVVTPPIFYLLNKARPVVSLQLFIPEWSYISWWNENELEKLIEDARFNRLFFDFIKKDNKTAEEVYKIYNILVKKYPNSTTTLNTIAQFLCPIQLQYLKLVTIEDLSINVYCEREDFLALLKIFYRKSEENPGNDYYNYATIFCAYLLRNATMPTEIKMLFPEEIRKSVEEDFNNKFKRLLDLDYCKKCSRRGKPSCINEEKKRVCKEISNQVESENAEI